MSSSFSSTGSLSSSPQTGLIKKSSILSGYNVTNGNLQKNSPETAFQPGQFGGATQPPIGTHPGLINPAPKTPVKKVTKTGTDGSTMTVEYHPESKDGKVGTSIGSSDTITPEQTHTPTPEIPKPTSPQVGTAKDNAQNVLNAGQMTPEEKAANDEVAKANELQKGYQNVQTLAPYAEASMYSDRARTPAETQALEQAPDLAGRAAGTTGLLGSLGNIYGSSRVAGANAALQGTQTAASRGLSAAGTVLGASIPGQISGSARTYNPLDPTGTSSIETGVNNQSKADLLTKYNDGLSKLNAAQATEDQIANTILSNPDINNQPLSLLTNLNQYISGQIGSAPQQLLAQQVNNYIQTLGLDPASVVNIATQQKGTLKQLLQSLKTTATNNNEALKKTADSLGTSNSTSSGGTTGANPWH